LRESGRVRRGRVKRRARSVSVLCPAQAIVTVIDTYMSTGRRLAGAPMTYDDPSIDPSLRGTITT